MKNNLKGKFTVLLYLLVLNHPTCLYAQNISIDTILKQKIDSLYSQDQKYRRFLLQWVTPQVKDSISTSLKFHPENFEKEILTLQRSIDSSNYRYIDSLINSGGYPGRSKVGLFSMNNAAYIILHSNHIEKYINLLEEKAKEGELEYGVVALLVDRHQLQNSKKQVYGTQVITATFIQNEKKVTKSYLWPIMDPEKVNKRRQSAGLVPIEEYAAIFKIDYVPKFRSVKKLKKMLKENNK